MRLPSTPSRVTCLALALLGLMTAVGAKIDIDSAGLMVDLVVMLGTILFVIAIAAFWRLGLNNIRSD